MDKKSNLKVVKDDVDKTKPIKKPTKAAIKKAEREEKERIKKQAEFQAKQMEKQIVAMGKAVKESICNQCVHCGNPNKTFDRFKAKASTGERQLFTPMNFCKLAGLSLVDVQECDMFKDVKKV